MTYEFQPDFVIKVGGTDVTKNVESWALHDAEDEISSIKITIVNDDLRYSGQFKINDKVTLRFGYQGNLSPQIEMTIKERRDRPSTGGSRITLTAMDCLERATGNSARGFSTTQSAKQIIKDLCSAIDCKNEQGNMKDPKFPEGYKHHVPNERVIDAMRRFMGLLAIEDAASSKKKGIKKQKSGKPAGSFKGDLKKGLKVPQGPITKETLKKQENAQKNWLENMVQDTSSITVRASAELVGVPMLQAKKCVEFANVGPDGSGKWYVLSCDHAWSVGGGYTTYLDCIKAEEDNEKPVVIYAEIYKKDTIYTGPRKIDAESQGRFTFGKDDKRIIDFEFQESVQEGRTAGEAADSSSVMVDDSSDIAELKAE